MATTTTNLGLTKPDLTDLVDIGVINTNMDKIDANVTSIHRGPTPPTTPLTKPLWWDTDSGTLYVYVVGTASSAWMAATSDPINIGVVANQTERDAQYPTPAQGMRVFRTDLGVTQTYYGLYNVSTNPGGRSTAGWYESEAGRILQVVNARTTTTASNSSTTPVDTGLTATITPKSATSQILVIVNQIVSKEAGSSDNAINVGLVRNGTALGNVVSLGAHMSSNVRFWNFTAATHYLDSPATTSALTYKTTFSNYVNASSVTVQQYSTGSTITLMEIAQ